MGLNGGLETSADLAREKSELSVHLKYLILESSDLLLLCVVLETHSLKLRALVVHFTVHDLYAFLQYFVHIN